jgi:uncharacterized membrane protein YecN with MAPEG domain
MLTIIPAYSVALGALFVILSLRVILARREMNQGNGGDPDLERRIRVHSNFAEYVPLALLLLGMAELRGASSIGLHCLCALLLAGRVFHAVGLSYPATDNMGRILGMGGTQTALLGGSFMIAASYLR